MIIQKVNQVCFKRRIAKSEESDYAKTLKHAREVLTGSSDNGNMLIVPSTSLPQSKLNNTGVGSIASVDAKIFFEFAKKYWGINQVQILPVGMYHIHKSEVPIYSGTSMDLGTHLIDLKKYLPEQDFKSIVNSNGVDERINFLNVIDIDSPTEKALFKLYKNMPNSLKPEFEQYKKNNDWLLESKALYRVLRAKYGTYNFKDWPGIDGKLYEDEISSDIRQKRITELNGLEFEKIDFFKFKQYLAEKSLLDAKAMLNNKGIKLYGDLMCGFTYDEMWAFPNAFYKNYKMGYWNTPALNLDNPASEDILRKKVNLYAKRFDGFRVDASWTYVSPRLVDDDSRVIHKFYGDKYLNIIDDEVKRVKGSDYNLSNIMHEFDAATDDFSMWYGSNLKPYVESRTKIVTSEHMSNDWATSDAFNKRGWKQNSYILGATNHDSLAIKIKDEQVSVLSKILKLPEESLSNLKEFIKAKFAEPMASKNCLVFFMDALGIDGNYKGNKNRALNYTTKIPANYEDFYIKSVINGKGYNPMDALEKQFIAKDLDKKNPSLFKKIVKYRKILEQPENTKTGKTKAAIITSAVIFGASVLLLLVRNYTHNYRQD